MVRQLRHRQTKGAATAAMNLLPPRHISTSQQNQVHLAFGGGQHHYRLVARLFSRVRYGFGYGALSW